MQKPDTKKRPTPARQRWTAQRHLCASYKDQKQAAIVTPNPCLAQQAESVSSNERGSSTTPGRTNVVECLLQGLQPSFFWCCALLPKRFSLHFTQSWQIMEVIVFKASLLAKWGWDGEGEGEARGGVRPFAEEAVIRAADQMLCSTASLSQSQVWRSASEAHCPSGVQAARMVATLAFHLCRSEDCQSMPKCGCGTTNVETSPESYFFFFWEGKIFITQVQW